MSISSRSSSSSQASRNQPKRTNREGASPAFYFFAATIVLSVITLLGALLFM